MNNTEQIQPEHLYQDYQNEQRLLASEIGEIETGSHEQDGGPVLENEDGPELAAILPRRASGTSSLAYANQMKGGGAFSRADGSQASNQAVLSLWQNKRDMDPRNLKTIQESRRLKEPRSHLDFFKGAGNSNSAQPNKAKFVRTAHSGWNKQAKESEQLRNIKLNSVVSDFRKGKKGGPADPLGYDSYAGLNNHDFDEQQFAKNSTMANTVQHDMSTTSGFKNIQDYLQEANLYSAKKSNNKAAQAVTGTGPNETSWNASVMLDQPSALMRPE